MKRLFILIKTKKGKSGRKRLDPLPAPLLVFHRSFPGGTPPAGDIYEIKENLRL
jgi:hypothetical protein